MSDDKYRSARDLLKSTCHDVIEIVDATVNIAGLKKMVKMTMDIFIYKYVNEMYDRGLFLPDKNVSEKQETAQALFDTMSSRLEASISGLPGITDAQKDYILGIMHLMLRESVQLPGTLRRDLGATWAASQGDRVIGSKSATTRKRSHSEASQSTWSEDMSAPKIAKPGESMVRVM